MAGVFPVGLYIVPGEKAGDAPQLLLLGVPPKPLPAQMTHPSAALRAPPDGCSELSHGQQVGRCRGDWQRHSAAPSPVHVSATAFERPCPFDTAPVKAY